MGREVRRVPPHWEHPKTDRYGERDYQSMSDESAEEAWAEWQAAYAEWLAGEFARVAEKYPDLKYQKGEPYRAFCGWRGRPPDPAVHRPHWPDGAATWFQVYETVSEGTPVSPPFATREELIDWLVNDGSGMGIGGKVRRMDPAAAAAFVEGGSAPSMVVTAGGGVQDGLSLFETPPAAQDGGHAKGAH